MTESVKAVTLEDLKSMKASGEISPPKDPKRGEELPDDFWDDATKANTEKKQ